MRYLLTIALLTIIGGTAQSQETIYPAPAQSTPLFITNATVHTGTGQVLNNTSITITNGKISAIGTSVTPPAGAKTIEARGKHVYPGLILSATNLGLVEVPSVRATNDVREIGYLNPSLRTIVAYNTDSKVINALRSNGILLANIVPEGGLISGQSSVVQLDAWNWEDAAYKMDAGVHFYMPSLLTPPPSSRVMRTQQNADLVKLGLQQIEEVKSFLRQAKAYNQEKEHSTTNLKFQAVVGLFDKSKKLYVHANTVKQMLVALDFVREFNVDMVIVGGYDSWQMADLLKQNNVAVILNQPHSLPILADDDIDQTFKTPAILQKAGVLFAITDDDGQTRGRNLAYNAGTASTYGLTREQALASITFNAAKILGIDNTTGSIETGKDANLLISTGDILDMRSSTITNAFIAGREINLDNKQKQLNERYQHKYALTR